MSKHETVTLKDILTKDNFLIWLRTQPRSKRFSYGNIVDCILCRYLKAHGIETSVGGHTVNGTPIPKDLQFVVCDEDRNIYPKTYGQVLDRATAR